MVFKRRDKRGWWRTVRETLWPQGGWKRAFHYVRHRIHRLPDDPSRIARGVAAGVFVSFLPLFGLHFFLAAGVALLIRGNVLASILGTFFGNPVTFPFIAILSTTFGNFLLGRHHWRSGAAALPDPEAGEGIVSLFIHAAGDLKHNFFAAFTDATAQWHGLNAFFNDIFVPYLVGSILPGIIAAIACYYLALPIITAYQNRRRAKIKERLTQIRAKLHAKLEAKIEERAERKEERRNPGGLD